MSTHLLDQDVFGSTLPEEVDFVDPGNDPRNQ